MHHRIFLMSLKNHRAGAVAAAILELIMSTSVFFLQAEPPFDRLLILRGYILESFTFRIAQRK